MICIYCGKPIPIHSKSVKYCSEWCSKNYLKAEYKKRNREKVNAYNRKWRKKNRESIKKRRAEGIRKKSLYPSKNEYCYFCQSKDDLHWHHVSYSPERVVRMCAKCHKRLHSLNHKEVL